jgi:hypothetical protein
MDENQETGNPTMRSLRSTVGRETPHSAFHLGDRDVGGCSSRYTAPHWGVSLDREGQPVRTGHRRPWFEDDSLSTRSDLSLEWDWAGFDVTKAFQVDTLLDTVRYKRADGADDAESAEQILLLRAAVASGLNAAHEELEFPLRRDGGSEPFVTRVNEATHRATWRRMTELADVLTGTTTWGPPSAE